MSTLRSAALCATIVLVRLRAQYAPAPTSYTVTQLNSMMGTSFTMNVFRDGSKVIIDHTGSTPVRAYYDLTSQKTISWNPNDASIGCSSGTFSGDWGDPFQSSKELQAELAQKHAAPVGAETVNGFATKVFEVDMGGSAGKARAWVDTRYGLLVKLQMGSTTVLEIKQATFTKPPTDVFTIPSACSAALAAPAPPTEAERIAAATGGKPEEFLNAIGSGSSPNSCTVLFRVVRAGSMQPIAGGFQLAIDKTYDINNPPHYTIGESSEGHLTYHGGNLTEVTGQLQQGTYRIENAPKSFYVDLGFGKGGESSALINRQCFAPQTVLLLVVKNPQKTSDGVDWLWVKSGKYAR